MGDLTKNFSKQEFECHGEDCCGHSAPIARNLLIGLQLLRDKVGPITVSSGFRCNTHNAREGIGGAKNSQHILGTAADVSAEGYTPKELAAIAATIPFFKNGGIGTTYNYPIPN